MSGEKYLDIDKVTKKPIRESLLFLSWLKDKVEEENRVQQEELRSMQAQSSNN
tara:strand:+ start:250 stop:408 length:159 start_codon:yes stop_codon:yes gene_type:complete